MSLIARECPRGHEVRAWRERAGYCMPAYASERAAREALADLLHCSGEQLKNWENEKRGVQMPADTWLLMRITLDPLARTEWIAKWIRPTQKGVAR